MSVDIGTAHESAALIAGLDPSQLTVSSVNTVLPYCPMRILYAEIVAAPSNGCFHLMITKSPDTSVVGLSGLFGTCAASTAIGADSREYPTKFLDYTLNEYVLPLIKVKPVVENCLGRTPSAKTS